MLKNVFDSTNKVKCVWEQNENVTLMLQNWNKEEKTIPYSFLLDQNQLM